MMKQFDDFVRMHLARLKKSDFESRRKIIAKFWNARRDQGRGESPEQAIEDYMRLTAAFAERDDIDTEDVLECTERIEKALQEGPISAKDKLFRRQISRTIKSFDQHACRVFTENRHQLRKERIKFLKHLPCRDARELEKLKRIYCNKYRARVIENNRFISMMKRL